ncbi:hypothetical protein LJR074_001936 [Acidovorax sp. LjRoot74]|uniref:hypothetical protein n=1 Tax=Acidovorax sp. LjRoot74 TaxID=3342337 RepID=UPI003ECD090E
MASADFFTRLVALNAVGPNKIQPSTPGGSGAVSKAYECQGCYATHDFEDDAAECCPPLEKWKCGACNQVHFDEDDAESCCPELVSAASDYQPMQCPVCMRGAESFEIAADCCLHTHPTMTALGRWRVAELVESGTPWADAIAQNVNH